jgi:hypothetical protein
MSSLHWGRPSASTSVVVFCWLQGPLVAALLLSITVTSTHTYGTLLPSYLISTTTPKLILLSQLRLYIFLCCISSLVREYLRVTINARADLNYTIMLSWMWGSGLRETFINLKSHSQPLYKSLFFTHRRGSHSFQRLSFWIDTQSTVKHEMKPFPLRVRSLFPTYFITKPDSDLLIIFQPSYPFPL